MMLADTSVWIDFLRKGNGLLQDLLEQGEISTHSLIIGELHVGNIPKRDAFLSLMSELPRVKEASYNEVIHMINTHNLYSKGVGFFDMHILASSIISNNPLWTLDKRLDKLSKEFNIKH